MKKIRLDLEALDVQSFATAAPEGARGTVHGAGTAISACYCYPVSYFHEETCDCPLVPYTREGPDCLIVPDNTWDQASCLTCATCAGMPGC